MKKIGKIFLILCVLFSQFSGVLRVYAEETNNTNEDNNKENNTENNDTSQEVTDYYGDEDNNENDSDNVITDDDTNNNSDVVDGNNDNNTTDDNTEDNNTGDTTGDGNTTGDNSGNTGDNTGDGNTTGEIDMQEVIVDTVAYDEDLNNGFKYNGLFEEGTLYLIGNEEGYTVSDIEGNFENAFAVREGEIVAAEDAVLDGDKVLIPVGEVLVEYVVVILGDDDGSGSVDNADVESVINNLFDDPEYFNPLVDIEKEGIVTVYDISKLHYAVNNKEKSEIVATPVLTPILSVDNDTLNIGDTVKFSLSVSGLETYSVNTISGRVSFDSSILSFSSASSEDGEVYFDEETSSFIAVGDFKEGSTIDIEFVAECVSEEEYVTFWDLITLYDGVDFELESNQVSAAISITAENNKGGDVEEPVVESAPEPAPAPAVPVVSPRVTYVSRVLSSDCKILDLKVKGYKIDFDSDTYEYHIKVGNKVKSLDIEVILSDDNATYVINGNDDFKEGENVVTVVVTAEDGSTKTYTLIVDKEKAKEATVEKESNISRYIVIGLIVLVIAGLIYLIFKDDEEEDNK